MVICTFSQLNSNFYFLFVSLLPSALYSSQVLLLLSLPPGFLERLKGLSFLADGRTCGLQPLWGDRGQYISELQMHKTCDATTAPLGLHLTETPPRGNDTGTRTGFAALLIIGKDKKPTKCSSIHSCGTGGLNHGISGTQPSL